MPTVTMAIIQKTVFISYRRTNAFIAIAIYQHLTQHGYDVFVDYSGIGSGSFATVILENIRSRAHFLVVLTPSALQRCSRQGDWLRREIETALDNERNIVPLLLDGFEFDTPAIASQLSGKLTFLRDYQALRIPTDYFTEAMERLRTRYLNVPLDSVLHQVSLETRRAVARDKAEAAREPTLDNERLEVQLLAERLFERALSTPNLDDKVNRLSKAILLVPQFVDAFLARADVFRGRGEFDLSLSDCDHAVRLQPDSALVFYRRGNARYDKGNFEGALQDYTEALRLNPGYGAAYVNRGVVRFEMREFLGAERDHTEALLHECDRGLAYHNRSLARDALGDTQGALEDKRKARQEGYNPNSESSYA